MKHAWLQLILLIDLLVGAFGVVAHEARPAYLQIDEIAPGRYSVLWRTPLNAGARLPVVLALPDNFRDLTPISVRTLSDSRIERRVIASNDGLMGRRIDFVGLQGTITDVLVRVQFLDGHQFTTLVHPSDASVTIPRAGGMGEVARTYMVYGIQHIIGGIDHLLFVLGLLLIVRGGKRIFLTVTAFTLAHSLTLAAATLGWVHVPLPPVEAIIALSIVFVAVEIVEGLHGRKGLIARAPWLVAFVFGLLHGFGFAGALAEVGLPDRTIPMALLCFNIGVEVGQLLFVAVVLSAMALLRRARVRLPRWIPWVPPYAIGGVAAFWMWQRVASFWL